MKNQVSNFLTIQATIDGNLAEVKRLFINGSNPFLTDTEERTALMFGAILGHIEIVRFLLETKAAINEKACGGYTALMYATCYKHTEIVKMLINAGADVNAVNCGGQGSLAIAVRLGHEEIAKILLDANADVNIIDYHGNSILDLAKSPELIRLLR